MRLAGLIACLFALFAAAGAAAKEPDCRNFSWSVGRTVDLFDEPLPVVQSSQALPKEGAFALELRPVADVLYPRAPERGNDGSRGGVVTLETVPAGRYQIALSAEGWVEAIQDNRRLSVEPSASGAECRGVHHSVEVEVAGEPLILQIGGATARRLNVAVVRIWPFEWRW